MAVPPTARARASAPRGSAASPRCVSFLPFPFRFGSSLPTCVVRFDSSIACGHIGSQPYRFFWHSSIPGNHYSVSSRYSSHPGCTSIIEESRQYSSIWCSGSFLAKYSPGELMAHQSSRFSPIRKNGVYETQQRLRFIVRTSRTFNTHEKMCAGACCHHVHGGRQSSLPLSVYRIEASAGIGHTGGVRSTQDRS